MRLYQATLLSCLVVMQAGIDCAFAEPLTVGVAANAVPAMRDIVSAFERETSIPVVISSGATAMLARQAEQGAPFDLLVLADMKTLRDLEAKGVLKKESILPYARGRLVLWSSQSTSPINDLRDLTATTATQLRLGIANPRSAPYGAAARDALKKAGVWEQLENRIIYSEDVAQALRYVETGNVDMALVPFSLVKGKQPPAQPVPQDSYDPIIQGVGIMASTRQPDAARQLKSFIAGSQKILREHGYDTP